MTLRIVLMGDGKRKVWQERHGDGVEYTTIAFIENLTNRNDPPQVPTINPLNDEVVEIVFRTPIPADVQIELTLAVEG